MSTLSISIIAKNEEKLLARCLESVKGADEIIICDTGSTDKTVEIAKKYTDKVYTDYEWKNHFADARNHAISKCTKDWIMEIDADDYLKSPLESVYSAMETDKDAVNIKITSKNSHHFFPNLHRNKPGIKYAGAAHNYLVGADKKDTREDIEIVRGDSPTHSKNPDRTFNILKEDVDKNPDRVREKFYLAREYYYRKDYVTAIWWYNEYLKNATWKAEIAEAYLMITKCYWYLQKGEDARMMCMHAIRINPNFKEALIKMGEMHYEPMKSAWLRYAETATNENVLFVRGVEIPVKEPMDLSKEGLKHFKDTLKQYKKVDVLEWGAGYSTEYFPNFLKEEGIEYTWDAMEHQEEWYKKIKPKENVNITLADKDSEEYLTPPKKKYDVIYIDGRNRVKCLRKAKELIKEGGHVFLHDAERERYREGFEGYSYKIIERLWHGQLGTTEIPKIIHQIWIGKDEMPKEYMDSWKEKNPNFEYKLWTEKEIDKLELSNRKLYDMYYKEGEYALCSDITRAKILYDEGGVYIDADTKCVNTIEDAPFINWEFFTAYAVDDRDRLANSPIGCIPKHYYLEEYGRLQKEVEPSEEFGYKIVGSELWTKVVGNDDRILPAYSFSPVFHRGFKNEPKGVLYGEHDWYSTKKINNGEISGKLTYQAQRNNPERLEAIKKKLVGLDAKTLLDFGGAEGYFSEALKEYNPVLVEDKRARDIGGVEVIKKHLNAEGIVELLKRDFDVVLLLSILHHFTDYGKIFNLFLDNTKHLFIEALALEEPRTTLNNHIAKHLKNLIENQNYELLTETPGFKTSKKRPLYYVTKKEREFIEGIVEKGDGNSKKHLAKNRELVHDVLGIDVFPGSLNVNVGKLVLNNPIQLKVEEYELPYNFYPCVFNGLDCFIMRPPKSTKGTQLAEIVSDVYLREVFGLNDGDKVKVSICNLTRTQQTTI